jgi:hypothetical protein
VWENEMNGKVKNMSNINDKVTASGSGQLIIGIVIGCVCSLFVVLVVLAVFEMGELSLQSSQPTHVGPSLTVFTSAPPEPVVPNDESPYKDIFEAASLGFVQDVKYFIENGVDVNAKGVNIYEGNKTGVTPLHFAAKYNSDINVLKYLIEQGADIHAQTDVHSTPLHYATAHNTNVAVMECLIEKGADINVKNIYGVTPLHLAARVSSDVTKYLIEQEADINMIDHGNRTPIDFARAMNREECETVLRKAGGKTGEELKEQEQ